jgi:DNA-binding response OmpR family regulator
MSTAGPFDILLVDDEAQLRRLLRSTLEEAGYTVREAETGRIALGEIALKPPSLVILDLGLPGRASLSPGRDIHLRPDPSRPGAQPGPV